MSLWMVLPRDPLVVRDGRPNQGRSESATLPFPMPGTVAGVVRTRAGSNAEGAFVAHHALDQLRAIALRGPLLAAEDGAWFVPAPRDALVQKRGEAWSVRPLHPIATPPGVVCDGDAPAVLVGQEPGEVVPGKTPGGLPAWWRWEALADWLASPVARDDAAARALLAGALRGLARETRVHVKLGPDGVAEESMLFETTGLRFTSLGDAALDEGPVPPRLSRERPLGLLVDVALPEGLALRAGHGPFGGERRLVRWTPVSHGLPEIPAAVMAALSSRAPAVRVRVVLLTPGHFRDGARPSLAEGTPLGARDGVAVRLAASLVPRPETVSGWDFALGAPKATRRLVAAGSVYWLDLEGDAEARLRWASGVWWRNVSDDEQARRDGYGLAVLGVA